MTVQPSHSTEHLPPPEAQAEEAIAWGKVIGVGLGSMVLFALSVWGSWSFMRSREKLLQPMGPDPIPVQIGQGEIGIVDQPPFGLMHSVEIYKRDRQARLQSWGWADRKQGLVHMPIDLAMDAVVAGHRR